MSGIEIPERISRAFDDELEVRRAVAGDLSELLALLSQLHDTDAPKPAEESLASTFEEILASPARVILVAVRGGKLIGTLDLFLIANLTRGGRPWAGIENLIVDGASRRQGVARALIATAVEIARSAGCYKLQLVSNEERGAAHMLYRSAEFAAPVRGYRRYLDA